MANLTGDSIVAMAQKQGQAFDPWALPESFTLYAYAPEDIRSFLHPHWHTYKAVHPAFYYFLALAYFFIGTAALLGNAMVIKIFSRFQALRTPANMLVLNLAVSDFILMLALFPECFYNFCLGGPWRFGELGCQVHAFLGALCGYNAIFTLTAISYDRYNVIVNGFSGTPLTFNRAITMITASWIWALGWSVCPLVGWGAYAMDGIMGTCSYDYVTQSMNNKTHILAACIANYVVPVTIIAGCYYSIVQAVFKHEEELRAQAKKMNVTSLRSNSDQQQVSAEIRIAKVSIMNVSLWMTAWTPFAVVCMMGTWGDVSKITPLLSALPVLLAKTSCVYNPLIYALSHPKYRECLKEVLPWMCIVEEKKVAAISDNQSSISEKVEIVKSESA